MNRRRAALVAASALVSGISLAGCGSENDSRSGGHGGHTPTSTASSSPSGTRSADAARQGDIAFAQGMIPHHKQAVEMADIALKKPSASADVRKLATAIRRAQDPEIKTMTGWLTSWGAPTAMPTSGGHAGHDMGGMMTPAEMVSLKKANGRGFDRQWMTLMIKHHQGAVKMATDVKKTTRNPDVRTLANAIIKGQTAEITTMRRLLDNAS